MFCPQAVEVWVGVKRMFTCKVGSCLSQLFIFDQQIIHDIKKKLGR